MHGVPESGTDWPLNREISTKVSQVYRRVLQGASESVQTRGSPSIFRDAYKNAAIAAFDATLEHKRATRTAYLEREEQRSAAGEGGNATPSAASNNTSAVPPTSTGAPSNADSTAQGEP